MVPEVGTECNNLARVLTVCELWPLFATWSLQNCSALKASMPLTGVC